MAKKALILAPMVDRKPSTGEEITAEKGDEAEDTLLQLGRRFGLCEAAGGRQKPDPPGVEGETPQENPQRPRVEGKVM